MADHDESTGPEGYQVASVEAWIAGNVAGISPPLNWTRLEGGHSNLTYKIEDTRGRVAVIRRPPQGILLPKAHDMSREWSLISCLGPTAVPVPKALGFCEDPTVTGAWFYLMGLIKGAPLYSAEDTERLVPEAKREKMAHSFIDVLADLHALDPDEIGLGELGKKENYIARQLKTWYRSWTSSIEAAEYDDPRVHELLDYFKSNTPEQGPARVVHGDYGVHNCLVGANMRIAAVVDWEISTLGDPLADLAYALNQFSQPGDEFPPKPESPTSVPGFPTRNELAARYALRSGRNLSQLNFYIAFNRWKSACIAHGVYARYMQGKKSTEGVDVEAMRDSIDTTLTLSVNAIDK